MSRVTAIPESSQTVLKGSSGGAVRDAMGTIATELESIPLQSPDELPSEFQPKTLRHRAAQALLALAILLAVILFAPGLGEVRDKLAGASPAWLVLATALEVLSFASYVVMFGPIFCTGLTWRRS